MYSTVFRMEMYLDGNSKVISIFDLGDEMLDPAGHLQGNMSTGEFT